MNDEYLWQKSGDDPEIRKLENALAEFRYRDSGPPALPVVVAEPAIRRWRFPIAIAATGFAAVVISLGVWIQVSTMRNDDEIVFIYYPTEATAPAPAAPAPAVEPAPTPLKEQIQRTRGVVRASAVHKPKKSIRHSSTVAGLTKEERYAYERLLLALSISSEQMNIVKNTINGVDDKPATPDSHNR